MILDTPERGFARSVTVHNVQVDTMADWIEGWLLFDDDEKDLSFGDVLGVLIDQGIYADQSLAWECIGTVWHELQRRIWAIGPQAPFTLAQRRLVRRVPTWRDIPEHAFLLMLSFRRWYRDWTKQFGPDVNEQGELFEELTTESFSTQFPDWKVMATGWTRTHPVKLPEVVRKVTAELGEMQGDLSVWADEHANEAGLDLLCYRPFPDKHVGVPVLMFQCASGDYDEPGKLSTPNLNLWTKYVIFASHPKKAFSTPFCFAPTEFRRITAKVDGTILDRCRLLAASSTRSPWVSPDLRDRLIAWLEPRVLALPQLR